MATLSQQILASLPSRPGDITSGGISIASAYLNDIQKCLSGEGACPANLFDGVSAEQWAKSLDEADGKLTYHADGMVAKLEDGQFPYGLCPSCGAAGVERELRLDGDVKCENGHTYPSKDALSVAKAADANTPTSGIILTFDHILTTRRKDRDGDVLEPKGATIDQSMPLLWQHLHMQPIGRYVKTLSTTNDRILCRSAIADTTLGRDAAVLVEAGALRISHGFMPTEAEPLTDASGKATGRWHITKYDVREVSLVSIPANADAVITAFSRKQLKHPATQAWAKGHFDNRRVIVAGVNTTQNVTQSTTQSQSQNKIEVSVKTVVFDPEAGRFRDTETKQFVSQELAEKILRGEGGVDVKGEGEGGEMEGESEASKKAECTCGGKSETSEKSTSPTPQDKSESSEASEQKHTELPALAFQEKYLGLESTQYLPGSFEQIQSKLDQSAESYLRQSGIEMGDDDYTRLIGTYSDNALLCCRSYGYRRNGEGREDCYKCSYSMDESGMPKFSGTPTPVKVGIEIIDKAFADEPLRDGKSFSIEELSQHLVSKAMRYVGGDMETLRATYDSIGDVLRIHENTVRDKTFAELL